jgi:hypothetical protein
MRMLSKLIPVFLSQGNYAADIKDYDAVVHHILAMADILSNGIIAQFPAKFHK